MNDWTNGGMDDYLKERVLHDAVAVLEATWNWQFMYDLLSDHCAKV